MLIRRAERTFGDAGASLLMVMFAIVFVAGTISVLLTIIDGGTRQSSVLNQAQAMRLAGGSALQAAEALVAKSGYVGTSNPPCLSSNGSVTYTDPNGVSFSVNCTLLSAPGSGTFSDGGFVGNNPQIGADAVVLTGSGTSLTMSGKGALNFGGNLRAYGNVTILPGGGSGGVCASLSASLTNCDLIDLNPGMAWVAGTCQWPGLFPRLPKDSMTPTEPYCSNLSNTSPAMTQTFQQQIGQIVAQAGSQLPPLATTNVANNPSPTCRVDGAGNGLMQLSPGYYSNGTLLSAYTGWDYSSNKAAQQWYVDIGNNCVTSKIGTTPVSTVMLGHGTYFFKLDKPWKVANQETLVGGTTSQVAGTNHYICASPYDSNGAFQVNNGVQLVFGSTSQTAGIDGIAAGDSSGAGQSSSRGVVTICGDYDGTHVPVAVRGVSSQLTLTLAPNGTAQLFAHSTPCNRGNSGATCNPLLANADGDESATSAYGSLNLFGTVFAPSDSLVLTLNPNCQDSQGNPLTWMSGPFLDCELNQGSYTSPTTTSGQVSIMGGIVLSGAWADNLNTTTSGAKIAQGTANWLQAAWVPGGGAGGSLDLGFTACSPSTTTCSYLAQSEAAYTNPLPTGSTTVTGWNTVTVHKWLD